MLRSVLTCVSIAANALTAGGIFTFPIIAPVLLQLKLSQTQVTTIGLAAMAGQYPFSSIVGKVVDSYGPHIASLMASLCFFVSFALFSREVSSMADNLNNLNTVPMSGSFERLTFFFALAGLGTVFAYFCILFSASAAFPRHLGTASGFATAMFGLSPLVLTEVASRWFTDSSGQVDISAYLQCLAILAGLAHLLGAANLRVSRPDHEATIPEPDETTHILPNTTVKHRDSSGVLGLLRDRNYWVLMFIGLLDVGMCEMVLSNLGTIVLSLPSSDTPNNASHEIRLFSISSTLSRLVVGPFADFVSPSGGHTRKHRISRVAFLFGASVLICGTTLYTVIGARTRTELSVLCVGMGASYGSVMTITPSVVSAIWGAANVARNFGMITYGFAIGTPVFSYIYAMVSSSHTRSGTVCQGRACWQSTFVVCVCSSLVSMLSCVILWRKWKGKL